MTQAGRRLPPARRPLTPGEIKLLRIAGRRAAFVEAPAEVQRIVQGKRGWWTVTVRCAKRPSVNAGDITEPLTKRSERLSGGSP